MDAPLRAEPSRPPRRCEDLQAFKSFTIEITCQEQVINKSRARCAFFPKCKTDPDRPGAGGAATAGSMWRAVREARADLQPDPSGRNSLLPGPQATVSRKAGATELKRGPLRALDCPSSEPKCHMCATELLLFHAALSHAQGAESERGPRRGTHGVRVFTLEATPELRSQAGPCCRREVRPPGRRIFSASQGSPETPVRAPSRAPSPGLSAESRGHGLRPTWGSDRHSEV